MAGNHSAYKALTNRQGNTLVVDDFTFCPELSSVGSLWRHLNMFSIITRLILQQIIERVIDHDAILNNTIAMSLAVIILIVIIIITIIIITISQ